MLQRATYFEKKKKLFQFYRLAKFENNHTIYLKLSVIGFPSMDAIVIVPWDNCTELGKRSELVP